MNLRDLEYLVALADRRHFGRAAQACDVSQPTLSAQLKKLEAELGVALIERSSGGAMLTAVGQQIAERARRVLAETADIRAIAAREADPRGGTITLGMFPTIGPYLLPHVTRALRASLPRMQLRLVEEKTADLRDGLQAGRLDAIVIAAPVNEPSWSVEPLFREDFVLAVPARMDIAWPSRLEGLDIPLLLLEEGHCLRDQALEVCGSAGLSEGTFRATSLETLRHMVAAGAGATLLPRLSVAPPVVEPDGLRLVELDDPRPSRELVLAWRPSSPAASLMPELAAALREGPRGLVSPIPLGAQP